MRLIKTFEQHTNSIMFDHEHTILIDNEND